MAPPDVPYRECKRGLAATRDIHDGEEIAVFSSAAELPLEFGRDYTAESMRRRTCCIHPNYIGTGPARLVRDFREKRTTRALRAITTLEGFRAWRTEYIAAARVSAKINVEFIERKASAGTILVAIARGSIRAGATLYTLYGVRYWTNAITLDPEASQAARFAAMHVLSLNGEPPWLSYVKKIDVFPLVKVCHGELRCELLMMPRAPGAPATEHKGPEVLEKWLREFGCDAAPAAAEAEWQRRL